jgi:hypothetical protein
MPGITKAHYRLDLGIGWAYKVFDISNSSFTVHDLTIQSTALAESVISSVISPIESRLF